MVEEIRVASTSNTTGVCVLERERERERRSTRALSLCSIMNQRYAICLPLLHHEAEVRDLFASVAS